MTRLRRTLSCLLTAGLTVPLLATVAPTPAHADTAVSGIALDSTGQDGLSTSSSSLHTPTYALSATPVTGGGFRLATQASTGATTGPIVTVLPPTGTSLAAQTYALARFADATHASVTVGSSSCATEGTLTVDSISTDPADGHLTSLSASFQVRCTGYPGWMYGTLRQNAGDYVAAVIGISSFTFPATSVGQSSAPRTVTVRSTGTAPLVLGTAALAGSSPADFKISDDTCSGTTVAAGSSCTLSLAFTPTAGGSRGASLVVPDSTTRGTRTLLVGGTGVAAPGAVGGLLAETATDGVRLTWSYPADDGGGSVTSYDVLRGTDPGTLAKVATVTGTSYADVLGPSTAGGTTYSYAVAATNTVGTGPASTAVPGTTPDTALTPDATRVLSLDRGHDKSSGADSTTLASAAKGDAVGAVWFQSQLGLSTQAANSFVTITGPSTTPLAPGTYGVATAADSTHVRVTNGYCPAAGSGTVVLRQLQRNAAGAIVVLDLDADYACGLDTHLTNHLAVRIGTTGAYPGVDVTGGRLPEVAVGSTSVLHSTYTNTGTTTVTVSGVGLTALDGSAAVDWSLPAGGATCAGAVLSPGQSCTTDLQVSPSGVADRYADVVYTDDTPAGTHVREVDAYGMVLPLAPASANVSRTDGKVTLSWAYQGAPGQQADSFEVLVGPDADHLTSLGTVPGITTSLTDPDQADGHRVYRIRATNAVGTGPAYDLPVDLGAAPPTLSGSTATRFAQLSWQPPSKVPANPITGWRLYRGTSPTVLQVLSDTSQTTTTVNAPAVGQHLYFAVAPLMGSTVGPRSTVFDLVGTDFQLVGVDDSGITVMSLAGAKTLTLARPGAGYVEQQAAVDPRGTKVAYVACYGYSCDLWVNDVAGGNPRRITQTSTPKGDVAWSPDGTRLAYTEYATDFSSSSLVTVSPTGTGAARIPYTDGLASPSWLGGTTLVAEDDTSDTAPLVKVAVGSGSRTPVTGTSGGMSPAVRPDGSEVAYTLFSSATSDAQVLRVVNLRTGAVRTVSSPAGASFTTPAWSRDQATLYVSDGSHLVTTRSDGGGPYRSVATGGALYSVAVSTPDVGGPAVRLTGVPASTLGATVTPTFTATDTYNGVASYVLSYRRAAYGSGFGGATAMTLTSPRAVAVAKGYTYCFSVRATDRAGNVSAATPEQCTVVPLDDRSLTRSSAFAPVTGSAYYAGTAARATARGATLSRPGVSAARQLYVVATTCSTCGTLDVLVGSTRVASLSLAGAAGNKRVLTTPVFSARSGTVTLKVTSSGRTVLVDGLGVRR